MHAESSKRWWRILTILIPFLALTGCGEGDGPTRILNIAATPLQPGEEDPCAGIATFEDGCVGTPSIENFAGGASDPIANPDKRGINTSDTVVRMKKFADQVFGGTKLNLAAPLNFEDGEAFTMKVWSPRPVPVSFKLEETGNNQGGRTLVVDHSGSGAWEELCFDFTGQTASIPNPPVLAVTLIFDGEIQGGAIIDDPDDGWTFYYDDIQQVASCEGFGAAGTPIDPDVVLYATNGDPDLVLGEDYDERTPFDSASVIDPDYAEDGTYSPVLSVFSGINTVSGDIIAQVGYIGFAAGFAGAYETLNFKIKSVPPGMPNNDMPNIGMPNFVIFVKLFDGVDTLRINLTSSDFSEALADDWFQVSIPLSNFSGVDQATGIVFESDDSATMQFHMLLTDIGFSGTGGGTGGGTATGGEVPEVVIFAADGLTADLAPGYDPFGSGSSFATVVDSSYANALEVTVGAGYAVDGSAPLAQLGLTGLTAGFATGFDEFVFKVKGLTADNTILAKLEVGGVSSVSVEIDLTAPPANVAVTDLGDGWSQVVIQMVAYGDVSATNQIVFQTLDAAYAAGDTFLLTDIGFNNAGGGTATGGEVPEVVIFAADGSTADLAPGYDPFGSGSSFATVVDSSYANALEVTVGAGYAVDGSAPLAQLGLTGLTAGFATGFDEFVFKVKGLTADNTILAKLEVGGVSSVSVEIDLTAPPANVAVTDLGDGWSQVVIQMVAYGDVSATNQIVFQTLDAAYAAGDTFLLTDIGFNNAGGGGGTAGNIAINGGFETGDFTGWTQFDDGGIQTIVTDNPSEGTYAANLNVPVRTQTDPAVDNLIKNANLEAGNLTPGAEVTVTWDMRGSLSGAGGVVFVELFSEQSGGGTSKAEIYTGGAIFPTADWQSFTWTTTLGPDVGGGVTLQLKTSCGPVEGCGVDAYFDNVTIVIN